MNVGLISDVHGDYHALKTAIDRLQNEHKVERILCAGDLVGRGPEPERVVDLIRELNIPTVRGNHDEWFYGLSATNAAYLKALPVDWREQIGGRSVFMCHGKPGNNMWGLYRDHISNTLLNMMLKTLSADVLIAGHTHMPMYVRVDRGCVVNPGSLYTFTSVRATSHTYGVLNLHDLTFDLYDIKTLEPVKQYE
jgi:putative phosphoesterase